MPREFSQAELFIDSAYIREDLKRLGISPLFLPREIIRPLGNLHIDGRYLAVKRTTCYDAVDEQAPTAQDHQCYLDAVSLLPDTRVKLGTVTGRKERRQKGVDTKIVLDMMVAAQSRSIDYIALASGDADFEPVVQEVQRLGPKVLVLAFKRSLSSSLARVSDRVIELPENPDRKWS